MCDHILCRYTESEAGFGALQDSRLLASSLEGKMIMEREMLYSQLVDIRDQMVCSQQCRRSALFLSLSLFFQSAVVQEMGGLNNNLSAVMELLLCRGHEPEKPLFDTLPVSVYSKS